MKYLMKKLKLTVIIRDNSPMYECNDSPVHRSVTIILTPEQLEQLKLRETQATIGKDGKPYYEEIANCFLEDHEPVPQKGV